MKLSSLRIEGFRRFSDVEVLFDKATFLIGPNNVGKSAVFAALHYLLSDTKKIPNDEYLATLGKDGQAYPVVDRIVFTAEFRDMPDIGQWRGFRGRILKYDPQKTGETGRKIVYRKTFSKGKDVLVEMLQYDVTLRSEYEPCNTIQDFIDAGIDPARLSEIYGDDFSPSKRLNATDKKEFEKIDELWIVDDTGEEHWVANPGGIPGNVLSKLPKFLLIPAEDKSEEFNEKSGTLTETLTQLFADVRNASTNYKEAQKYLDLLEKEMNPDDETSEFGKLMIDLNGVLGQVFPDAKIHAKPSLSNPDTVLKPSFGVTMSTNIPTKVSLQGTGLVRAAVFALLRYKTILDNRRNTEDIRPVLVAFEEPEIYLHPNAANQLRDTLYTLASSPSNQIVCTTHSPYMIDLSRSTGQVLNNLIADLQNFEIDEAEVVVATTKVNPFTTSQAYQDLRRDDKDYVKMLIKIDDYVSRVFFCENVLIIEGDTEEIVLRESIARMPERVRRNVLHNWQVIKARGKASIIPLVRYLKAMGIVPYVLHDKDSQVAGAQVFNASIDNEVGDSDRITMMQDCIEDVLGYSVPSRDKPFTAYKNVSIWGPDWSDIPDAWRQTCERIFASEFLAQMELETSSL